VITQIYPMNDLLGIFTA